MGGYAYRCNCVEYAKYLTGRQGETWGWARDIIPNATEPAINSLILLDVPKYPADHVGVVVAIEPTRVLVAHANWPSCVISKTWFNIDDPRIKGYKVL